MQYFVMLLKRFSNINFNFNRASITWEKAEELKKEHCYVAFDYMSELQIFKVRIFYMLFCSHRKFRIMNSSFSCNAFV